ncbi:MAG: PEP-CTERM sorting domain-containing protein [Puniceicoccaceae bacterium]
MSIPTRKRTSVALLAAALSALPATSQAVEYEVGDLVIGFRATGGTGANDIFMYNVGSAQDMRDGTFPLGPIGINLDSSLASVYGSDWSSRSDVRWAAIGQGGAIAVYNERFSEENGDLPGTVYVSRSGSGPEQSTEAFDNPVRSVLNAAGLDALTILDGAGSGSFANVTDETADGYGGFNTTDEQAPWDEFFEGGVAFQAFPLTVEDSLNAGTDYLDIYRYAGSPVSNSYIGTLALDDSGNLSLVPEPGHYGAIFGLLSLAFVFARRRRS